MKVLVKQLLLLVGITTFISFLRTLERVKRKFRGRKNVYYYELTVCKPLNLPLL